MNATEQIALLRRACEMVLKDGLSWQVVKLPAIQEALQATATPPDDEISVLRGVFDKIDTACKETGCQEGLAYAVWIRRLAKERDALKEEVDWLAREWPSQVAAAIGSTPSMAGATPSMLSGCVQHEVARLTKERDDARLDRSAVLAQRDEALAKLAAAQKELADIYAAKPEPLIEYVAQGWTVQRRTLFWGVVATCESHDDAQRIADALNGGKP